jgi:CheY-like chemotaxis protein
MKTVLVTDDDRDVRTIIRMRLEVAQYRIVEAADGATALELARQERPDLVILDLTMPGMNGIGVLSAIRNDPSTAHIPVMLVSGADEITDKGFALTVGANICLHKPLDARELLQTVRELLGENC